MSIEVKAKYEDNRKTCFHCKFLELCSSLEAHVLVSVSKKENKCSALFATKKVIGYRSSLYIASDICDFLFQ